MMNGSPAAVRLQGDMNKLSPDTWGPGYDEEARGTSEESDFGPEGPAGPPFFLQNFSKGHRCARHTTCFRTVSFGRKCVISSFSILPIRLYIPEKPEA